MFSIGIPAFKSKYLKECIDGILSQSFADFELIIINDCSPDPIDAIVSRYTDKRIKYYVNERNIGAEHVVDNWNKCLEKATGTYFILMGDDDKMEQNYLEEFATLIKKYPGLDVYHCRAKIINEESTVVSITPINPEYEDIYDYILSCFERRRQQYISDFVYTAKALKDRGGFFKLPLAWVSDYVSSFIACGVKGIAHTNNPVFNYRVNKSNITSTGSIEKKWEADLKMHIWLQDFLPRPTRNELDLIKYNLIKNSAKRLLANSRFSLIRQILGKHKIIKGSYEIFKKRRFYQITLKDCIGAIANAIADKITNQKAYV